MRADYIGKAFPDVVFSAPVAAADENSPALKHVGAGAMPLGGSVTCAKGISRRLPRRFSLAEKDWLASVGVEDAPPYEPLFIRAE